MADFKSIVVERDINPYHSILSSFFTGFTELGSACAGERKHPERRRHLRDGV
jgi:hypothetical protein